MKRYALLLVTFICIATSVLPSAFAQIVLDDSQMRRSAAARIARQYNITVNWQNTSLMEITGIEARLNAVKRIRRNHDITFDWRKKTLLELIDIEARMNSAKRIQNMVIDWRKHSILELTQAEAKLRGAKFPADSTRVSPQSTTSAPQSTSVIESKIDGDFEGWDGDTIVKLMNGQIWQQTEYHYHYQYAYMPDVLIYNSYGIWKMKVEGADKAVSVKRLK